MNTNTNTALTITYYSQTPLILAYYILRNETNRMKYMVDRENTLSILNTVCLRQH